MDAYTLKLAGMKFLAYEKRCVGVVCERGVHRQLGNPDILGVAKSRHQYEIEVKLTMADFRNNAAKRHVQWRDRLLRYWPKNFWFLVPPKLVDKVRAELPQYAGLLTVGKRGVECIVEAPVNHKSAKLSLLEAAKMLRCITNHTIAAEERALMYKNIWKHEYTTDFEI